jgi:hypothetical protein
MKTMTSMAKASVEDKEDYVDRDDDSKSWLGRIMTSCRLECCKQLIASNLAAQIIGREGRSEENWCHAANSKCSINLKTHFGPDVLTG